MIEKSLTALRCKMIPIQTECLHSELGMCVNTHVPFEGTRREEGQKNTLIACQEGEWV